MNAPRHSKHGRRQTKENETLTVKEDDDDNDDDDHNRECTTDDTLVV